MMAMVGKQTFNLRNEEWNDGDEKQPFSRDKRRKERIVMVNNILASFKG